MSKAAFAVTLCFVLILVAAGAFYLYKTADNYAKVAPSLDAARDKMTAAKAKAIQAECAAEAEASHAGEVGIQGCIERMSKE